MGYHRAGFDVVGVDINPQPRYPFEFHAADSFEFLRLLSFSSDRWGFAAIHASPPCQAYTTGAPGRKRANDHPDLVAETRFYLQATKLPYVIENVPNAPLVDPILLCGSTFDLPLIRHRLFELSFDIGLVPSLCPQSSWRRGVAHRGRYAYAHGKGWHENWRRHVIPAVWPWMEDVEAEAGQAIPPAYTEYIGARLLEHLESAS